MANDDPGSRDLPNGSRGTPSDPSWLTTQQLRETEVQLNRTITERISGLRELVEQRLDGMDRATELLASQMARIPADADANRQHEREITSAEVSSLGKLLEARISAMDKATELLAATVGRVPSDTDKQVGALQKLLESRIDGMDEATKLLAVNVREVPTDIDKAALALRAILQGEIRNVQDVAAEKFTAIDGTFGSNALALTAALAAQKEAAAEQNKSNTLAITKSEVATKEKIDSNAQQTATSLKSLADRLDDLKERVDRGEGQDRGQASVTGSPYEASVLRQTQEAAERTAKQAEEQAKAAREEARSAQARAVMALVISGVLLLISLVSIVFAITKKLRGPVVAGDVPAGGQQGQLVLGRMMAAQGQYPRAPDELRLAVLGPGRGGVARRERSWRERLGGRAGPPDDTRHGHVTSRYRA